MERHKRGFVPFKIVIVLIQMFFVGCTGDIYMLERELSLPEGRDSGITPFSVIKVTKCVDTYLEFSGGSLGGASYRAYTGTHCWTCLEDDGYELKEDEYIAGGFPEYGEAENRGGGGSSHRYTVGDDWRFGFPTMEDLYGFGSNLNVYQKGLLENAMKTYKSQPSPYPDLYEVLNTNNIKISFKIDPSIKTSALYNAGDTSITFNGESSITSDNLSEELIHAVQHNIYYKSSMNNKYKNYEFEAKVFHDLAYAIAAFYDNLDVGYVYTANMTNTNPEFAENYEDWISSWAIKGYLSPSAYSEYNRFCQLWNGYEGEYVSMTPKLIEAYFRKPHPPKNPR